MWSEVNNKYVEQLVISNRGEYPYYVAHTCTYWGVSSTANRPSFKVYFSKEPITANGLYSYVFTDTYVCYSVISSNANINYNDNRVSTSTGTGTVIIDDYEFVYSNAEYSGETIQPDITATNGVQQSHFDAVGLILLTVLLATVVTRLIRR